MDTRGNRRSGAHNSVHGSPLCASPPPLSNTADVKAFLMASEGSPGVGGQAACNADNLPAHFKHRSELPSPTPSPPPPSSPSPSPSSTTTTTTAASTTSATPTAATSSSSSSSSAPSSSSSSSSSAKSVSSVPQSLVLVPGSPPQTPRAAHDNTALPAALPSRLAQLRQSNLAKKREQMKTMKMPELSEHAAESSSDSEMSPALTLPESPATNGAPTASSPPPPNSSSSSPRSPTTASSSSSPRTKFATAPQVSVTCVDDDDGGGESGGGGGESAEVVKPPSPTEDPVTPSIPESFLKQLGLLASKAKDDNNKEEEQTNGEKPSVERLPDKQLESRFNSLALAFKTDRLTLDKRLSIQERSRDIAEQNIDRELQGLRDAVEVLKQLCEDERVHTVISRIQHHLDILEHSVARLSSRAEVFGAVQQEKRMCLAMEVMVTYTENIQRLRATEQSEVEEARRVLNSSRQIGSSFSLETLSIGDRRSASVCAGLNNPRAGRRRSEVALPRFFGGTGSPSLHISPSMEPRQRFQSATANVTVRNVVTNTLRRASLERQRSLSGQNSNTVVSFNTSTPSASSDRSRDKDQVEKQNSQEEEAYRHGYEEGLKASLSRELTDLRDQQATISTSLEEVMDRVDTYHTHSPHSDIDDAMSRVKEVVAKARKWLSNPNRQSARQLLRGVGAALFFILALVVAVVTLTPLVPGHISLRNHAKSAQ